MSPLIREHRSHEEKLYQRHKTETSHVNYLASVIAEMSIVSFLLSWSFPLLIFGRLFYKLQFEIHLHNDRKPKAKRIPGPILAAWSRIWLLKNIFFGKLPDKLVELPKQYGKEYYMSFDGQCP
jgi:hypothetical protein